MNLPKYTQMYSLSVDEANRENERIKIVQGALDIIIGLFPEAGIRVRLRDKFKDIDKIDDDILFLVSYYIKCIHELRKIKDKESIAQLFIYLKDLEYLESVYMKYMNTQSPYYKNLMENLVQPYFSQIKALIYACKSGKSGDDDILEELGLDDLEDLI